VDRLAQCLHLRSRLGTDWRILRKGGVYARSAVAAAANVDGHVMRVISQNPLSSFAGTALNVGATFRRRAGCEGH